MTMRHASCEIGVPAVLVADDDLFSRTSVSTRLAQLDVKVLEAEDGGTAMGLLGGHNIVLAIVDLEMPGIDGFTLLGCIRGHPKLRHIPVVVLTGRDDREAMSRALLAGATSFIQKPLNWQAFGRHITHLLELSGARLAAPQPLKHSLAR